MTTTTTPCLNTTTTDFETLRQRHAEATDRMQKLQEELEKIQLQHIGHRLIMLAGQAAVKAGKANGMGLFEQYEAAKETQKVLRDAQALAYMWPLAKAPAELQRGIDMLELKTLTGSLAASRLVEHYDEVLAAEFELMTGSA